MASSPKRSTNLPHPVCGSAVTSMIAVPMARRVAGGQVLRAQVEVHVQLIAGERPPLGVLRDQGGRSRIHDIELHLRMRTPVGAARAAASAPRVARQPFGHVELPFLQHLSSVDGGASHDQRQHPFQFGGVLDVVEPGLELRGGQVGDRRHRLMLPQSAWREQRPAVQSAHVAPAGRHLCRGQYRRRPCAGGHPRRDSGADWAFRRPCRFTQI